MGTWSDFSKEVEDEVRGLAAGDFAGLPGEFKAVADQFLASAQNDLELYSAQLQAGEINEDDFADNVRSEYVLVKLDALTDAGIALARAQEFRDALLGIVINAAIKVFIP